MASSCLFVSEDKIPRKPPPRFRGRQRENVCILVFDFLVTYCLLTNYEHMTDSDASIARATGFSECAIALRRALTTTPVGWLLALWFCWDRVPSTAIFLWLGTAAAV